MLQQIERGAFSLEKRPGISLHPSDQIARGTLLLVFGAIGFGVTALTALISSILALGADRIWPFLGAGIGIFLPLLAVFGGMMLGGGALRRRAQRYRRYREELGNSAFCPRILHFSL